MINVNEVDIKKLTLKELYDDAAEREGEEALDFLDEQSEKVVKRKVKDKNGVEKEIEVIQPITYYRKQYLVLFCGWVEKSKVLTAEKKVLMKQKRIEREAAVRAKRAADARAKHAAIKAAKAAAAAAEADK